MAEAEGHDRLLTGGGGGWSVPDNSITLPPDASDSDPRIYIGPDDPIATFFGQDAAIVLYWGEDRAFVISVDQSGSPDYGQLKIFSQDPVNGLSQYFDINSDMGSNESSITMGQNLTNGFIVIGEGADRIELRNSTKLSDTTTIGDGFTPATLQDINGRKYGKIQKGTELVSFAAAILNQQTFNFPQAFALGEVPNVHVNIASQVGAVRWFTVKADQVTESSFRLTCLTTDAAAPAVAWVNVPVTWTAIVEG